VGGNQGRQNRSGYQGGKPETLVIKRQREKKEGPKRFKAPLQRKIKKKKSPAHR